MKIPYYQVDAFTNKVFGGNPAGVCPLDKWLDDSTLQAIAAEHNLSETAFYVPSDNHYELRWLTPNMEVDLCGHATLATAHVLYSEYGATDCLKFSTKSGLLAVNKEGNFLSMSFPSRQGVEVDISDELIAGLGSKPKQLYKSRDYLAVFDSEETVRQINPNAEALLKLDCLGIIATAPGSDVDFVSRFFAPSAGILEDPVTGSAHCTLIPYWSRRLQKQQLEAKQISQRGGYLRCEDFGDRVKISGQAVTYCKGEINI
ncbi:PhzF family phenazine biosynthesis protein [Rubellicoccus peritrichatus]|uniref:PhzF family phenazine biosynthesis protein n=1 Tax=Rubellicoccus peritrichatus TaxID=3080537 RepID=A0AAQ3L8P6_9BACT|nr:PhzF family phenazine biosynthesis protein [Puniceicoccus sp. CR14]WOO39742.1 PhzF family phenazine biosynthesis protein [Puniceicoccus sp. CR14]